MQKQTYKASTRLQRHQVASDCSEEADVETGRQLLISAQLGFKYGHGKNGNLWRDSSHTAKNRSDTSEIGVHSRQDKSSRPSLDS